MKKTIKILKKTREKLQNKLDNMSEIHSLISGRDYLTDCINSDKTYALENAIKELDTIINKLENL